MQGPASITVHAMFSPPGPNTLVIPIFFPIMPGIMLVFQDFAFSSLFFVPLFVEKSRLLRKKDCKDRKRVFENKSGFRNFSKNCLHIPVESLILNFLLLTTPGTNVEALNV